MDLEEALLEEESLVRAQRPKPSFRDELIRLIAKLHKTGSIDDENALIFFLEEKGGLVRDRAEGFVVKIKGVN